MRSMSCRDESFVIREAPTGLPDLVEEPGLPAGRHTERICRTVHGPVQARGDGVALARRYAIWGRELETIVGLDALNRARTVGDVDRAMRKVTWNENVIAVDDSRRDRLLASRPASAATAALGRAAAAAGNGRRGVAWIPAAREQATCGRPAARLAHELEQRPLGGLDQRRRSGAGAACRPAPPGPHPRAPGAARGARSLLRRLARHRAHLGDHRQQFPFADQGKLDRALRQADGPGRRALLALARWDGSYDTTDSAGTVQPGVAVWEAFKETLARIAVRRVGGEGAATLAGETSLSHQFDITNGESFALRTLRGLAYAKAAHRTAKQLERRFDSPRAADWREPRRMYEVAAMGAASSPDLPFFDRGTWEQSLALGRR